MKTRLHETLNARATTALLISFSISAWAASQPADTEIRITGFVVTPAVALSASSRTVVAWNDAGQIWAQQFRGTQPIRQAFRVSPNPGEFDYFSKPQVGVDNAGRFIVAWQSEESFTGFPPGSEIFARRYRSDGRPLTTVQRINDYSPGNQTNPRLSLAPDGDFAIAWDDFVPGADGLVHGARIAAYRGSGLRVRHPVAIPTTAIDSTVSAVASWDNGFAAALNEGTNCTGGDNLTGVNFTSSVSSYAWDGSLIGVARISDGNSCDNRGPVLLNLSPSSLGPLGIYLGGSSYTMQRYSPYNGNALAARRAIAPLPACTDAHCEVISAVAGDANGRFVVVWESSTRTTDASRAYILQLQLFGRDGLPRSQKIPVTGESSRTDEQPAVAIAANGVTTVVWRRLTDSPASTGLFLREVRFAR